ncbi:Lactose permease 30 [Colletotrichum chlorophyti]|uniref:Lactose permease 30 n=1 Tax=Colletotrichum chlorophyti TaxID=708187 RepID=A0A1Q8RX49_9PEZI|nr:Lactose permease 30 [Colletotrichum chlorophyti]
MRINGLSDVQELGFGSMFIIASCPILLTELAHPRHRAFVVAAFGSLFFIGSIIVSWTAFGTTHLHDQWSWRVPTILQIIAPALQLPLMLLVPESPRWLVCQNRSHEAKQLLIRFHGNGDPDNTVVSEQYEEIYRAIRVNYQSKATGWAAWLCGPGNRRRLLLVVASTMFAAWCGSSIVTIYFSIALTQVGITEPAQQTAINGGLQAFNLVVALLGSSVVDKFGRRLLFMLSSIIMLIAMIGFTAATAAFESQHQDGSGVVLVVLFFLFQLGFSVGYGPLSSMYITEICTYDLRAKGVALHYLLVHVSAFFATWINPIALKSLGWRYYIVYVGVLAFQVVFTYLLFPETKGYTVEQISQIFDH